MKTISNLKLEDDLYEFLKERADGAGKSVKDYLEYVINMYLDEWIGEAEDGELL